MAHILSNAHRYFSLALLCLMIGFTLRAPAAAQSSHAAHSSPIGNDAQTQKVLRFEVISIKPERFVVPPAVQLDPTPNGFTSTMTARQMIMFAYAPEDPFLWMVGHGTTTIHNVPPWLDDLYQINARVSDQDRAAWNHQSKEHELLRSAMQDLLRERYKLLLHEQPTQVSGYKLTVAKNGPRLTSASPGSTLPKGIPLPSGGIVVGSRTVDHWYSATMGDLAFFLTRTTGRTVYDSTGLTGRFDFTLQQTEDPSIALPSEDTFELVNNWPIGQLGLQLKPGKVPAVMLIIDHIEKPTKN